MFWKEELFARNYKFLSSVVLEVGGPAGFAPTLKCHHPSQALVRRSVTSPSPPQDTIPISTLNSLLTVAAGEDLTHTNVKLCCSSNTGDEPKRGTNSSDYLLAGTSHHEYNVTLIELLLLFP